MQVTKIESRRDYELYIKHKVALMTAPNKIKAIVRKIAMEAFDDGIAMVADGLEVETDGD